MKQDFNNYKISTIIPIYNGEKYISSALKSVINQTYNVYEIIIVNDKSNDNTLKICEDFKKVYDNIKIINLSENMGVSNARNIGIQNASGDYIHFMDSDDIIENNMYEEIVKSINNKDIIITGTRYNENEKISTYKPNRYDIKNLNEMKQFIEENCISERRDIFNVVWNKFYKREFIINNNIKFNKNISFGEDFLFNLECMSKTYSIYVIDEAYYNYMRRKNEETLKMKFLNNKIDLRRLFYKKWIEFYKYYGIYEKVAEDMERYEGFKIYNAIIQVANDCPLDYEERIKYIKDFTTFENSNCLFKYMESENNLNRELGYLANGEIEKFYEIIINRY